MAIHFSTSAWKIPWTEEPGRLQSMGSQRVGHPGQSSLSAGALRYRAWAQSWSSAALAARSAEKLPEVTGTSRGNPEFPEVTRERLGESFFNVS